MSYTEESYNNETQKSSKAGIKIKEVTGKLWNIKTQCMQQKNLPFLITQTETS